MVINLKGKDAKFIFDTLEIGERAYIETIKEIDIHSEVGSVLFDLAQTVDHNGFDKELTEKTTEMKQYLDKEKETRKTIQTELTQLSRILDAINPKRIK